VMKYPKPGYPNPLVSVHVFDLARFLADDSVVTPTKPVDAVTLTLDWDGRQKPENSVIFEVAWIDSSTLIVKEVNRNADDGSVVLFDLDAQESRSFGSVVRKLGKNGEEGDEGWIDSVRRRLMNFGPHHHTLRFFFFYRNKGYALFQTVMMAI
jgi:dipeptidyl aminopeptidase